MKDVFITAEGQSFQPMNQSLEWDAEAFIHEYTRLMGNIRRGVRDDYFKIKELRADEFQNTIKIVNKGYYTNCDGIRFPLGQNIISRFYKNKFALSHIPAREYETDILVVNEDCLFTAEKLITQGYNPAVLNMASRRNPGGGVLGGAGAQEETIFRRSDLFRSLYQYASYASRYGLVPSKDQYPLDANYGGIYSSGVSVFRMDEAHGYALMDAPVKMSFVSVAGMNRPELDYRGMISEHLVPGVKNKIRTILRIGLQNGHDSMVLGALGCGAFCNPPRHVARLFNEVINEQEFRNKFRLIAFSVLEDHNSRRPNNPEGNFKPFYDEFMK